MNLNPRDLVTYESKRYAMSKNDSRANSNAMTITPNNGNFYPDGPSFTQGFNSQGLTSHGIPSHGLASQTMASSNQSIMYQNV